MIYSEVVAMFESIANQSIPGNYFNEGPDYYRNREDVIGVSGQPGVWVLPMTATDRLPVNASATKSYQVIIVFYKQTSIDFLQEQLRQTINDTEALARAFMHKLDEIELLQIGDVNISPGYKQLDNSFTGVALSFALTLPDNYVYC